MTGFLVMFMQAGFALVETGFTRAKNAMHTMSMNFMVYAIGIVGFFLVGFGLAFGGIGTVGVQQPGRPAPLSNEIGITIGDTTGASSGHGFALTGSSYDVGVIAFFLFQLVFMDTAATIPTGSMAERFRFKPSSSTRLFISAILYPFYANWAWGGGWLSQLGLARARLRLRRLRRLRRRPLDRRLGRPGRGDRPRAAPRQVQQDGSSNTILGHNQILAILGTFILAFGWFGFNPGSTFGAAGNGALRIGIVAVVTMIASASGPSPRWSTRGWTEGKPNPGMMATGCSPASSQSRRRRATSDRSRGRHRRDRRRPRLRRGGLHRPRPRSTIRSARSRSTA